LWYSHAGFQIVTNSSQWDYIWWWKSRNASDTTNDHIKINNASASSVSFNMETFDISWMNFLFSAWSDQATLKANTLYYPAKRDAFRWSYNGIDISGDGRWCNEILWGFYVHEYSINSDWTLKSAAIDFVQYCEKDTSHSLYWSIRYNSTIAVSCTNSDCSKAKQLAWWGATTEVKKSNTSTGNQNKTILLSSIDFNNLSPTAQAVRDKRVWGRDRKYKVLLKYCDLDLLFGYDKDRFSPQVWGTPYTKQMQIALAWMTCWCISSIVHDASIVTSSCCAA
jgi:hypothetical protein